MLDDDADTITFSTASADTFTSVTCAQCEPVLIHKENKVPMLELLILVFSGKCRSSCTVLYCEHRSHYRTSGPHTALMESVSDWSVWSVTCTPVACWRSFCRALAVLLLFLLTHGADIIPDAGLLSFYISVHLSTCLASQYLLYVLETVLGDTKPSMACMMDHPGGSGLSVQPDCVAGTAS